MCTLRAAFGLVGLCVVVASLAGPARGQSHHVPVYNQGSFAPLFTSGNPLWGHNAPKMVAKGDVNYCVQLATERLNGGAYAGSLRLLAIDTSLPGGPGQVTLGAYIGGFDDGQGVYQPPALIMDKNDYLHIFYVHQYESDRGIRHLMSTNPVTQGVPMTFEEQAVIGRNPGIRGYLGVGYHESSNSAILAYSADVHPNPQSQFMSRADLPAHSSGATSWSPPVLTRVGSQTNRILYSTVVPTGSNSAFVCSLHTCLGVPATDYCAVLFRHISSIEGAFAAGNEVTIATAGLNQSIYNSDVYYLEQADKLYVLLSKNFADGAQPANTFYLTSSSNPRAATPTFSVEVPIRAPGDLAAYQFSGRLGLTSSGLWYVAGIEAGASAKIAFYSTLTPDVGSSWIKYPSSFLALPTDYPVLNEGGTPRDAFYLYARKPWYGGDTFTNVIDLWYSGYKVFYNPQIDAAAIATRYFRL
ncbi:MAG: hypothetical protein AAF628_15940 [Planctomycetota bacterium]